MSKFPNLKAILEANNNGNSINKFQDFKTLLEENERVDQCDLDLLLRKAVEYKVKNFDKYYELLINKGANVNFIDTREKKSNLMIACEKGNQNIVEILSSNQHMNFLLEDNRQRNALFYALQNRNRQEGERCLKIILNRSPDLVCQTLFKVKNSAVYNKKTLLIIAIERIGLNMVKILLENGADPNQPVDDTGNTPLHQAVKTLKAKKTNQIKDIIKILIQHGANYLLKNRQDKNVYQFAQKAQNQFMDILEKIKKQKQSKQILLLKLNQPAQFQQIYCQAEQIFTQNKQKIKQEIQEQEQSDHQDFIDTFQETTVQMLNSLEKEILSFQKDCAYDIENISKEIIQFMAILKNLLQPLNLGVEVYGSFATGLWMKHCDIDLMLVPKDNTQGQYSVDFYLDKVYDLLLEQGICISVNLNKMIKFPMIRLELSEGQHKTRKIDITIYDKNHNGKATVSYIRQYLELYPLIKPIFYIIKSLTYHFKLYDPKNGGIRTYAIFIMLLSFIQKSQRSSLSQFLIDFLYFFGFFYEYSYLITPDNQIVFGLNILDPLNINNNVGNKTNVLRLQNMFKIAYIALHSKIKGNKLQFIFDMKKILQKIN